MTKPASITAHDLLKTFAVIIMVIDHVGYYFYPDDLWWRAVGRIGFPIWFYLVGHAAGRDLSPRLIGGAVLLLAMNVVAGMPVFPLNALVTIIIVRLVVDKTMRPVTIRPAVIWPILALFAILFFPTEMIIEYGTFALVFAMFGFMVRNREALSFPPRYMATYMFAITGIFLALEWFVFGFDTAQMIVMGAGTLAVCAYLLRFRSETYPSSDAGILLPFNAFTQFCGRRTLEIYVAHLVLFKLAALAMGMSGYEFLSLEFFSVPAP